MCVWCMGGCVCVFVGVHVCTYNYSVGGILSDKIDICSHLFLSEGSRREEQE